MSTANERRERYAAAILEGLGHCPHADAVDSALPSAADAAMAVADAERENDRLTLEEDKRHVDRVNAENERLRSELDSESADKWAEYDRAQGLLEANTRLSDEVERLSRELAAANARQRATWDLVQSRAQWIFDLQGEKGQLREALVDADTELERLRAEMNQLRRAAKTVTDNDWYGRLSRAIDTLNRIDQWTTTTEHGEAAADVMSILEGVG